MEKRFFHIVKIPKLIKCPKTKREDDAVFSAKFHLPSLMLVFLTGRIYSKMKRSKAEISLLGRGVWDMDSFGTVAFFSDSTMQKFCAFHNSSCIERWCSLISHSLPKYFFFSWWENNNSTITSKKGKVPFRRRKRDDSHEERILLSPHCWQAGRLQSSEVCGNRGLHLKDLSDQDLRSTRS